MSETVIKIENVSKLYRLGVIGSNSIREDFEKLRRRIFRKQDPHSTPEQFPLTVDKTIKKLKRNNSMKGFIKQLR